MDQTTLQRPHYFEGMVLSADDFSCEQNYFRALMANGNSYLHTPGIANGLLLQADSSGRAITVTPGMAIDAQGRQLILNGERKLPPEPGTAAYVVIYYSENRQGYTQGQDGSFHYSRIAESPDIVLQSQAPTTDGILLGRIQTSESGQVYNVDYSARRYGGIKVAKLEFKLQDADETPAPSIRSVPSNKGSGLAIDSPTTPFSGSLSVAGQVALNTMLVANLPFVGVGTAQTLLQVDTEDGSPALTLDPNGRMGIATANPLDLLHLASGTLRLDGGRSLTLDNGYIGDPSTAIGLDFSQGNQQLAIRSLGTIDFSSGMSGGKLSNSLFLNSDGTIGVGTSQPTYLVRAVAPPGGGPNLVNQLAVKGVLGSSVPAGGGTAGFHFPNGRTQETAVVPVPVGTVVSWYTTDSNPTPPAGYMICNGDPITDPESPFYNAQTPVKVPDFSGGGRLVRGSADKQGAGAIGGLDAHTHDYAFDTAHIHGYDHFHGVYVSTGGPSSTEDSSPSCDDFNYVKDDHTHSLYVRTAAQSAASQAYANTGPAVYGSIQSPVTTTATGSGSLMPPAFPILKIIRIK